MCMCMYFCTVEIRFYFLSLQFVKGICEQLKGNIKSGAFCCSLIKVCISKVDKYSTVYVPPIKLFVC